MLQLNFSPFPVLKTQRLVLRKLKKSDLDPIKRMRSDERVNKFIDRVPAVSDEDALLFINRINKGIRNRENVYWGIILKDSNSLVGAIGLWNFSQKEEKAEIGFELMPEYQGRGLMMEALPAVIDYGFDKMKLEIITASTHKENIKSVAVLLKNNFQLDSSHVPVNQLNSNDFDEYILSRGHL